jgi:hypothetical protein
VPDNVEPSKPPPVNTERTSRGTVEPASGPDETSGDDSAATPPPDLDAREARQSARRRPAGPGGPSRPAPRPSDDAEASDEAVEPEPWGCDPTAMPPTDPAPPGEPSPTKRPGER